MWLEARLEPLGVKLAADGQRFMENRKLMLFIECLDIELPVPLIMRRNRVNRTVDISGSNHVSMRGHGLADVRKGCFEESFAGFIVTKKSAEGDTGLVGNLIERDRVDARSGADEMHRGFDEPAAGGFSAQGSFSLMIDLLFPGGRFVEDFMSLNMTRR